MIENFSSSFHVTSNAFTTPSCDIECAHQTWRNEAACAVGSVGGGRPKILPVSNQTWLGSSSPLETHAAVMCNPCPSRQSQDAFVARRLPVSMGRGSVTRPFGDFTRLPQDRPTRIVLTVPPASHHNNMATQRSESRDSPREMEPTETPWREEKLISTTFERFGRLLVEILCV